MGDLFHFTAVRLAKGSIIEPGNWGRLLKRYEHNGPNGQNFGNAWILSRELVFELVRREIAPGAPERMNATFSFTSQEAAHRYRAVTDFRYLQVLHRVELVDTQLPQHLGPIEMINWPESPHFLDPVRGLAIKYWRGEGDGDRELVSASALRVVECLE